MPSWTPSEIRQLNIAYNIVSMSQMCIMIPRHSANAIRIAAMQRGLTRKKKPPNKADKRIFWLQVAHEHFAKRELEMRDAS